MVRPQIPLVLLWHVFGTDKVFIVTHRHHHRVFASTLAVIYGWLILQFYVVLEVVGADSFSYISLILMLPDYLFFLLDPLINSCHQKTGNLQGVWRLQLVNMRQVRQ